jgi:hypothetical protein
MWPFINCYLLIKSKVKSSCPATGNAGVTGERKYSSCSFVTSALDADEWSALSSGRVLPPGKDPGTHRTEVSVRLTASLNKEAREKSYASNGDRAPVV